MLHPIGRTKREKAVSLQYLRVYVPISLENTIVIDQQVNLHNNNNNNNNNSI